MLNRGVFTVLLVGLLVAAIGFRWLEVRRIPAFFTHDELHYVSEARSLAIQGSDLTGTWQPWQLRPTNPLYAELPSLILSPGSLLFSDVFAQARFTPLMLGILLPLLLGGITWRLTHSAVSGWATVILGWWNPWLFQFSRMSFDALLSLFFYALAILLLLQRSPRWRLLSLLPWALAFFQYQGLKLIFLPLLLVSAAYLLWTEWPAGQLGIAGRWRRWLGVLKTHFWPVLLVLSAGFLLFSWYLWRLPSQSAGQRVNDLIFFNQDLLASRVNEQRRLSLADPLLMVTANKLTVISHEFLIKYTQTFDPTLLFVRGESVRNPFSVWTRGIFYPLDLVLIGAGLLSLWSRSARRPAAVLLLAWAMIAPLPVAVNSIDTWVMFRGAWLVPTVLVLAGIGVGAIWEYRHHPWLRLGLVAFGLLYATLVGLFLHEYFFRYPVYATKGTAFAQRVLANYMQRLPAETEVVVLVDEARFVFLSYLVYNNLIQPQNLVAIGQAMRQSQYQLGRVRFTTDCLDVSQLATDKVIVNNSVNVTCEQRPLPPLTKPYAKIVSPLDNGALFTIYNDRVCHPHALRPFIHLVDREALDVERLSTPRFCDLLFSKPVE